MIEVRAAAEACARWNVGEKGGVRLIDASPAEPAEQRVPAVDYIVHANIKIIPIFDYFCGVRVIVEQAKTRAILRVIAIGLGKNFQISLPNRVDSIGRNHVGLRTRPHELQSGGRVENRNG